MKYLIAILISITSVLFAYPIRALYDSETPRPSAANLGLFDAVDYSLFIPLEPPFENLDSAFIKITLTNSSATDSPVVLDLESIECDSVKYSHPAFDTFALCDFEQDSDRLIIDLPSPSPANDTFYLTVYYHGEPDWGYFVQTNRYGDTVIYSLSWPSNARCWFPCVDHPADKASATIRIFAPSTLQVASNGIRTSADTVGDYVLHTWRTDNPICTYNICFSASRYVCWSDTTADSIPIMYFAYPNDSALAQVDWGRTPAMLDSFERYYGDYPFAKYGMATTPFGLGGMEHQSITFLGDGLITGSRTYEAVVAHELSHSWFGNSVGLGDWRDFWMNEGFAVFSEFLFTEIFYGEDAAKNYRRSTMNSYFSSGENFPMFDPDVYLSYTCYNRAAMVVNMLRFLMGDSTFFDAVRDYTEHFKYKTVTHDSLKAILEEHFGESLDWFFDEWVFQAGYPRLEYYYRCENDDSSYRVHLHITQNNIYGGPEAYIMPLEIELETGGGDLWDTVWVDSVDNDFYWDMEDSVTRIRIDPNYTSLCQKVVVSAIDENKVRPRDLGLQISPNPFNSRCRIKILNGNNNSFNLDIKDISGKTVEKLKFSSGVKEYIWDTSKIESGIYFIELGNGMSKISRKAIVIK